MISGTQLAQIQRVLDGIGGLDALWVFGSEASGKTTASSDVDLAALFASPPSLQGLEQGRAQIEEILGRPVDLIELEAASPVLAMQALRHGRLLVERSATHRVRFEAALPGRYEDVVLLRRPAERLLRARLAHGRA